MSKQGQEITSVGRLTESWNVEKNISEAKKKMGESGGGKVDKAGAKKAMGEANAEFKKGNYEGAVTHYTTV